MKRQIPTQRLTWGQSHFNAKITFWKVKLFLFFIFIIKCFTSVCAQETAPMRVVRCNAVDQRSPIVNVYVDEANNKWVATAKELYLVQALDLATPQKLAPGEQSVLQLPGGNHDYRFSKEALMTLIGNDNAITTAFFDKKKEELWIGTAGAGAFQLRTKPSLQVLNRFNNTHSKIKSNAVNTIFIDQIGEVWIGTDEGVLVGKGSRWSLEERLVSFARVLEHGNYTWLLGNGFIWKVNGRGDWIPVDIDVQKLDGEPLDFAIDSLGRLWIASEVMTLHDPQMDVYQIFGPVQYYTSQYATAMMFDKDGTLWVGTEDKGLYVIESEGVMSVNVLVEKELGCDAAKNDAAVRIKVTGGKGPFTYVWTGGLSGDHPQNLGPGEYTVTVTDSEGKTKSAKAIINNPRFSVQVAQDKVESAPGAADGVASVTIVGNAADFSFQWDTGETTKTAKKLTTGNHTVTVTDKKGCSATGAVVIGQQAAALNVEIQQISAITCANEQNAALKVVVTGGKPPFQYQWNDAKISGDQPQGLAAGSYQLKVTDAAGQNMSAFVTIQAPPPLSATAQVQAPASTGNADGKALVTAKGGTGNYSYQWDNGETSATAGKLAPGKRNVTVTDANGCTTAASVEVLENVLPLALIINELSPIKCAGSSQGALQVTVSGGKAPYQYQWNDAKLSGEAPAGLTAGSYQVTVTDAVGTKTNASITLKAPEAITVTIQPQAPASTGNSDGKALANVKGGSGNFTFKWDNGETAANAVKLAPGKRSVTVTDANGCSATATIDITENILPLAVTLQEKNTIKCAGASEGSLTAQVSGGKPPYQYQWNDAKLSGEAPAGLTAGSYQVTVTDAVGTKTNASITLKAPEAITVTIQPQAPASTGNSDGKALANVKGGSGNFTFKWDNGETAANAVKLAPGKRSVTVTDANGCSATATIDITENILPLTVNLLETTKIRCAGTSEGALQVQVSGGKPPFQYQWNLASISGNQANGLIAGTYVLTVTDAAGTAKTATIALQQPAALTAAVKDVRMATSPTVLDGKASVAAQGGSGSYTFQWSNGETGTAATKLPPGNNTVTVTDGNGCTTVATFETPQRILAALSGTLRSGQTIRMEQLQFEADSSTINEPSLPVLNELKAFLQENPSVFIEIGGHTNSLPPDEVCDRLSTARAKSVVDFLIENGVDGKRLSFKGYGKRVPIADNRTPEGRQQNQRVEIKILRVGRSKEEGGG